MTRSFIYANHADDGITQLLSEFSGKLSHSQVKEIKRLRGNIYGKLENPDNTTINVYIEDDTISIIIGRGEIIENIYINGSVVDVHGCHEEKIPTIKLSSSYSVKHSTVTTNSASGKLKTTIGAGIGALTASGLYAKLSADPFTGPLIILAIGGAVLGCGVVKYYDKPTSPDINITTHTYEKELSE